MAQMTETSRQPGVGSSDDEPIAAVLARVAPVDLEGLTLATCERWLADAVRVAGWLAVTRARVEELH